MTLQMAGRECQQESAGPEGDADLAAAAVQ
jgi:hypothetical protein